MQLNIMKTDPRAKLPTRATTGSAGFDLYALLDAPSVIAPGERVRVSTGIAIALVHNICLWLVFIVRFSISNERKNRLSADSGVAFTDRLVAGKTFLDVSCDDGLFDNRDIDDPFILCLV